jgi:hypothetical protein
VWLPRVDNSAYASTEFAATKLVDAKGNPVAHKVERGLYDHDIWEDEIRFAKIEGMPARMIGTVRVRYPVRIRAATANDREDAITKPEFGAGGIPDLPDVVVEQWRKVDITYDLPVLDELPEDEIGSRTRRPDAISDTPGGKVVVRLISREDVGEDKKGSE